MPSRIVIALISAVCAPTIPPATAQPLRAVLFDGVIQADRGLTAHFSRPLATLDDAGLPVASDDPRFADRGAIAGAVASFATVAPLGNYSRLAVGPAADSSGWVLCAYNGALNRVEVSAIDPASGELTDTVIAAQTDEPFQSGPTDTPGTVRRFPNAFSAAPGLLVALCQYSVYADDPANPGEMAYVSAGVSFVVSVDSGATWSVLRDYPNEPQYGLKRVREWAMRQWYTLARSDETPNEVWIPAVDYRASGGTPAGWSGFLVRAARESPDHDWSIEVAKIRQHDREGFLGGAFHAHSMGLVPDGEGGMIVLVPVGDTIDDNAIIKGSLAARADWRNQANWSWDDAWHGSLGDPNAGATEGLQGVGMCVGPDEGTLLIGSDTQADAIYLVDARAAKGSPKVAYKPAKSDGTGQECFTIVNPHPHAPTTTGWFATTRPKAACEGEGASPATYARVVRSPDGRNWAEIMSAANGSTLYGASVGASDRHVFVASALGAPANNGLTRRRIPAVRTFEGLTLSNGATRRTLDDYTPTPRAGVTITDETDSLDALGVAPLPAFGRVFRAQRPAGLGALLLTGNATPALSAGPVSGRVWVYNLADGGNFLTFADIAAGGAGGLTPTTGGGATYFANKQWFPIDLQGVKAEAGPLNLRMQTANYTPVDVLVSVDSISDSALPPPFPIDGQDTHAAPETLSVRGFDAADGMTVYHAFRTQPYGVDVRWRPRLAYPALAAYLDADNYILVEALVCSEASLRLTVVESGAVVAAPLSTIARWSRDEQVLLGLAYDRHGGSVELSFSLAGGLLTTLRIEKGSAFTTLVPDELRLAWFDGSIVFPTVHCAVAIAEGRTDDATTREGVLSTTGWIPARRPGCSPDVNADGAVDFADLNAVLSDFGRLGDDLLGDANCDGAVDFADLNAVLSAYGSSI